MVFCCAVNEISQLEWLLFSLYGINDDQVDSPP